jgi:hypothetical protein
MPSPSDRIGDDRLREILAGCETGTPDPLAKKAQALLDAVSFDDHGSLVGAEFRGGNGGLISHDTLKAADILRAELLARDRLVLDPQTVSSIVSELLSHRERLAYRHDELVEAVSRHTKEPAHGED